VTTLNFVLQGRDALSRTLDGAGDAADRMRRRMDDAASNSARAIAGFTRDSDGALRDLQGNLISTDEAVRRLRDGANSTAAPFANASDKLGKFGDQIKASLISLAPAAIPAVAGLAGAAAAVGAQLGAAGVAAGAYALALGPQIAAISKAAQAQEKYDEAVQKHGRTSREATAAQAAYLRELEQMPPATRNAAVAVGLLKDNFEEWSDSLSGDVMAPFTKGIAVTNALLPKTTGLAKGASTQFDRLITMVGGGISSPGFDALNGRFTTFANDTMRDAVDGVAEFFDRLDKGQVNDGGLAEFLDYVADAGPLVGDTLRNVGEAVLHVLEAGSGVGMGMLDLINALSNIVAAVPPGAIAALLQMAIAIKAVRLAAAGGAAASAAMAAIAGQMVLMRTAAAGTPGMLAGVGAAITTLSRTAKIAVAGTGIGLLLLALAELSAGSETTAPDVDKLTTSLGKFGSTGKVSGEAAAVLGKDFEKLRKQLSEVIDPSVAESINNWGADVTGGFLDAGEATEKLTKNVDAIDDSLAALVSAGNADLAAAALEGMLAKMSPEQAKEFTSGLGDYNQALDAARFEAELAAEAQGLFGAQALEVQGKLAAQKASADGLSESIHALNDAYLQARGGVRGMEAAIDAASEAFQKNGKTLDENTAAGRANNQALDDLAASTMQAAEAARANGASWAEVSQIQDRGRQAFIRSAQQMGLNEAQARSLANQILRTPNKTAYLKGDLDDLKAKLADAKARLAKAPSEKKTAIKGEISDLTRKVAAAQRELQSLKDRQVKITMTKHYINITENRTINTGKGGRGPNAGGATGGQFTGKAFRTGYSTGGLVDGPGTSTSDSVYAPWLSVDEYVIKATSVAKYGVKFMDALNAGLLPAGRAAPAAGRAAPVTSGSTAVAASGPGVTYNVYPRASVISVEDLRLVQRQEEARQRVGRPR
jgi:hypothetical protein